MMDLETERATAFTEDELEDAVEGYLECAGWLVNDHELATDEEREQGYEGDHREGPFTQDAYESARGALSEFVWALDDPADVRAYLHAMSSACPEDGHCTYGCGGEPAGGQLGHDLWLTRNGHGAGFWDRGLGELGERLSEAARSLGEAYAFVNAEEWVDIDN